MSLKDKILTAVAYINEKADFKPAYGIILGTGLGNLSQKIEPVCEIPYQSIPHFPVSTVQSHAGKLVFGTLDGIPVVCMAGRFHYYEGYSMQEVTFPVRVLAALGIRRLYVSNVSGSTNPDFLAGDIIFVRDHINLQPDNPLRGANDETIGPRFPDMVHTYDNQFIAKGLEICKKLNIRAATGVYACLPGPNLETPAEYEYLHRIGADLAGMSTVPEVIVARHMYLPVMVISIVSNQGYPHEMLRETTVEEVIAMGEKLEPKLTALVITMMKSEFNR
jgi:purine-nucleoside phosphorylase